MFWLEPAAPVLLGSVSKTHLKSMFCAILIYNVGLADPGIMEDPTYVSTPAPRHSAQLNQFTHHAQHRTSTF